ncbi:MAG: DUF6502 family protein [Gammaproteobacteria bacterium]|nr:DUF6502 family protein [Gammaproteobacteria bacterium]MDH5728075.1 DUF6502 family protein [Gammaproteobacteria bacterium]
MAEHPDNRIIINALRQLLRPLVKLLIRLQISYPFMSDLLKQLYVDVAQQDFQVENKKLTDSRINVLTGVHRKDIRRLRQVPPNHNEQSGKSASVSAQVLSTWISNTDYCFKNGKPKPLFRLASSGEPSFETLVEAVTKQDMRSRTLLDEWLRINIISIDDKDKLHLKTDAFLPVNNFEDKAYFFGQTLEQHMAASSENILNPQPQHFDRFVYCNNLSEQSVKQLQKLAEKENMNVLKNLNKTARELQKQDKSSEQSNYRIHLGSFFYSQQSPNHSSQNHEN